jgi:sec-independent protein translocase protein TatA
VPNIGPMELAIVLVAMLLVFGPKRLTEVGRAVGRGIREFKDSLAIGGDETAPGNVGTDPSVEDASA